MWKLSYLSYSPIPQSLRPSCLVCRFALVIMRTMQRIASKWLLLGSLISQSVPTCAQSLTYASIAPATCMQTQAPSTMNRKSLEPLMISDRAVDKACDPSARSTANVLFSHTFYNLQNILTFNSSLESAPSASSQTLVPTGGLKDQACAFSFNAIVSDCIFRDYSGGWIENAGINYTGRNSSCKFC